MPSYPVNIGGTVVDGAIPIGSTSTGHPTYANISAGTGISVSNGSGSVTITNSAPAAPMTWVPVTSGTPVNMVTNQGYINTFAGTANLVLPTTSAVGDVLYIITKATSVIAITYGTGQNIVSGNNTTSSSTITTGNVTSVSLTHNYTFLSFYCVVANTQWISVINQGDLTFT